MKKKITNHLQIIIAMGIMLMISKGEHLPVITLVTIYMAVQLAEISEKLSIISKHKADDE